MIAESQAAIREPVAVPGRRFHNRILAGLPKAEHERLAQFFSPVTLQQEQVLSDEKAEDAWLPEKGIAWIVLTTKRGDTWPGRARFRPPNNAQMPATPSGPTMPTSTRIQERRARRLLSCRDRVEFDQFTLTDDRLAMFWPPRAAPSPGSGTVKVGVLESHRGTITARNRAALERDARECYAVVHEEYRRLGWM